MPVFRASLTSLGLRYPFACGISKRQDNTGHASTGSLSYGTSAFSSSTTPRNAFQLIDWECYQYSYSSATVKSSLYSGTVASNSSPWSFRQARCCPLSRIAVTISPARSNVAVRDATLAGELTTQSSGILLAALGAGESTTRFRPATATTLGGPGVTLRQPACQWSSANSVLGR